MLLRGISYNNNGAGVSVRITVSKGLSWNDHKQCDSDVYDIPGTAFLFDRKLLRNVPIKQKTLREDATRCMWNMSAKADCIWRAKRNKSLKD